MMHLFTPEIAADADGAWSPPLLLTFGCLLTMAIYLRGFVKLRASRPTLSPWRAVCFCGGVLVFWIALGSPLEELADTMLSAHMVEHLLLMSFVPPLVLMGWPVVPLLRGLPDGLRRRTANPLLRSRPLRGVLHRFDSPLLAWLLMNGTLLGWHLPKAYDFALEHEGWHLVEHACFLGTSMLFWWILLRPWPSDRSGVGWWAILYLISADLVNTALSATLAFVGHPMYPFYLAHTNAFGLDPGMDQTIGASIMWVFGSLAFLVPALAITGRLLSTPKATWSARPS